MLKKLIFLAVVLGWCLAGNASLKDLPVRTIKGREYYCYQVQPGEGEIAIAKKLGIPQSDIRKYNPSAEKGLKAYQELYFPVSASKTISADKPTKKGKNLPEVYVAKKGDSLYGVCKSLGITQERFLELNPQAVDGLKADEVYRLKESAPAAMVKREEVATEVKTPENPQPASTTTVHTIGDHESLYAISQIYGCTVDDLLKLNPSLDPKHYEAGEKIVVPMNQSRPTEVVKEAFAPKTGNTYCVKDNDTFYGIARAHGITIEQLQAANPGINVLKRGTILEIPQACQEGSGDNLKSVPVNERAENISADTVSLPSKEKSRINIALVLPLHNSQKEQTRHTKNYADFTRGFMFGVDSLKNSGMPISISVFDTHSEAAKLDEIISNPLLAKAQVIVTSGDDNEIEALSRFGNEHNIQVLNMFAVKDSLYLTNPSLMQANIPNDKMVKNAISHVVDLYPGYVPVIVTSGEAIDKKGIASKLASAFRAKGISPVEIKFNGKLEEANLRGLSKNKRYLFVPTSSKQSFANNILPGIVEFRESMSDVEPVVVLGYPEWITFKGTTLKNMKSANTLIYSRFSVPSESELSDLNSEYKKWYGHSIPAGVPRQSLMGFDAALYLIKALSSGSINVTDYPVVYVGVQNPFHFEKIKNGGYVNDCMYIINYRPSGSVEKLPLSL